jgi:hypothetical protein
VKHNLRLLITLIIATPCLGMEKEKQNLQEITAIKNPRQAFFLTDNRAVINGENGCSIIDLNTGQEITKISNLSDEYLAIHPNKSLLALAFQNFIDIYDAKTGIHKYSFFGSRPPEGSFYIIPANTTSVVFNHAGNIVSSYYESIRDWYYIDECIPPIHENHLANTYHHIHGSQHFTRIICHPTDRKTMCLIDSFTGDIIFRNTNQKYERPSRTEDFLTQEHNLKGEFSPDGSLLACYNPEVFFVIDIKTYQRKYLASRKDKITTQAITFHPEGSIIATLSDKEDVQNIDYWDTTNKKIILSTALPKTDNTEWSLTNMLSWFTTKKDTPLHYSLSFSPDQKHLMIITGNRCFSMSVPVGITCRTDIKEQIFLYWLLNNSLINDNIIVPSDIAATITQTFLETFKQ